MSDAAVTIMSGTDPLTEAAEKDPVGAEASPEEEEEAAQVAEVAAAARVAEENEEVPREAAVELYAYPMEAVNLLDDDGNETEVEECLRTNR
ncbi:hypothetical protein R5R35_010550 [Gryllus longicercus]|uniref:Uncharacterized protein n=1 Tax=Gryllus longicercus TaxID=2509291 RepID=A0AAN9YWB0_9ORTH|nr:Protein of unknown function [Gryllus bimaculatus]